MPGPMNGNGSTLAAPEHVNFFYGLLLDEERLKKEELYLNQKRWMLNRLVLGTGVVCGLNVTIDPHDSSMVIVQPGIALDPLGHEIVVPDATTINPFQLTDDTGSASGTAEAGVIEICLAYAETLADPVPVLVADCDHPGKCACSTVREGFHLLVRQADLNPPLAQSCSLGTFPLPANGALQAILSGRLGGGCATPPADPCVRLARVTINNDNTIQTPDTIAGRPLVYGNSLLYELLLCLSDRLSQAVQGRMLRYISGDGQSAKPGDDLNQPLIVQLLDGAGQPVSGGMVQFQVTAGGGSFKANTVNTDANGQAQVNWTNIGPNKGDQQQATASAVGSVFLVTFNAIAT